MESAQTRVTLTEKQLVSIERAISDEMGLYRSYVEIMERERKAVTRFSSEALIDLAKQRDAIVARIEQARGYRENLTHSLVLGTEFPLPSDRKPLSALLFSGLPANQSTRLLPHVQALKDVAKRCHEATKVHSRIVEFASSIVAGTLSILWSATQTVSTTYGKNGKVADSYVRDGIRKLTTLKEV